MSPASSNRASRIRIAGLCGIFVLFVWLPMMDWLLHLDNAPMSNENRVMASFPRYEGFFKLKGYLGGFEAWFNDHFGFRKRLIRTSNHWKHQLFRDTPNAQVLVGPHGWLFTTGMRVLENYLGIDSFTQGDMEAWRHLLEQRRDWVVKHGGIYLFVITPDKHTIYPEELPLWMQSIRNPTKAGRFMEYMRAHSSVEAFFLRDRILESKRDGMLFLKTDSHWNNRGAFIGYQTVIDLLSRQVPGIRPVPASSFTFEPVEGPGGDQASVMGVRVREPQQVVLLPHPPVQTNNAVPAPERLAARGGRPVDVMLATNPAAPLPKVVMFHDSFGKPWRPLLAYNFREALSVAQHFFEPELLEREKPAVVIDQFAERFFNYLDPRELEAKDRLN